MQPKTSLERLEEVLKVNLRQQQGHPVKEAAGEASHPPAPLTIAISRESGANGHLIARAIGKELGWAVYDRELVELLAKEMRVRAGLVEEMDEKQVSWWQECMAGLRSERTISQSSYAIRLAEALVTLAARGPCVIVGRGAAQVLPRATTLRVRLVGPQEDRIAVVQRRLGISHEKARSTVEQIDRGRSTFVADHFRTDANNARNYDLIVSSTRFSVEACARLVIEALHQLQAAAIARHPAETALTA
jgi:cytidylate kinase